jgi:hypothetical protein
MTNWLNENNAEVGQIVELSGDQAKIINVVPNVGITIETLGAGMKLRINYLFKELSMRGAKVVTGPTS